MLNPYKSGAFGGREKVNSSQASTIRIAPNDTKSKKCYNITWAYEPIVCPSLICHDEDGYLVI